MKFLAKSAVSQPEQGRQSVGFPYTVGQAADASDRTGVSNSSERTSVWGPPEKPFIATDSIGGCKNPLHLGDGLCRNTEGALLVNTCNYVVASRLLCQPSLLGEP